MTNKKSPLGGINIGSLSTVTMCELPNIHAFDLRVAPGTASFKAVVEALDINLPTMHKVTSTRSNTNGAETHALCLAPDWWLITDYQDTDQKLSTLKSNEALHFSLVDVSDQRTSIELGGPSAKNILAHVWEQDLRDKNFPVSSVSQGLIAKAPVIVWHYAPTEYRIMVRSSFAVHVWQVLEDSGMEYYGAMKE